ncbi:MAG: extracellular matrix regulator RemB [Syntrophomonadaceae bacterium]|jgi:regulator of extracellular matrix RemA (YlzA/DUF370 family)|nr:DUF370 domain-containing protein [Syntrophomonadaceae bacterium]
MYVHLGNNFIIAGEKIIAVLNYAAPVSEDVKEIVEIAELEKKMVNISNNGKEKAVVVCDDRVYLSPISSVTLLKRAFHHYKEG